MEVLTATAVATTGLSLDDGEEVVTAGNDGGLDCKCEAMPDATMGLSLGDGDKVVTAGDD